MYIVVFNGITHYILLPKYLVGDTIKRIHVHDICI